MKVETWIRIHLLWKENMKVFNTVNFLQCLINSLGFLMVNKQIACSLHLNGKNTYIVFKFI